ncbi:MAG: fibrillarin-like rRNA/tRNA 2'-O-methyltransferase [Halobacteria archaeon]
MDWIEFEGNEVPATSSEASGERRTWMPTESKFSAAYVTARREGVDLPELDGRKILYLGGGAGTTAEYVADLAQVVYVVEFAPSPTKSLIKRAEDRNNLIPLLRDARKPDTYSKVVEKVDFIYQDVATRGQAKVACENAVFLKDDGNAVICIKARSEDISKKNREIYHDARKVLEDEYSVESFYELEPFYTDHGVFHLKPR